MNFSDPEHLTRLFAYMRMNNRAAILEAERGMLKEEIRTIELERDAAVASTVATFEPELTERRKRLEEVEDKIAGEQIGLFKVVALTPNFDEAMKVTVKDSPFNAAMNYAAKYPASQEPIGPVIPCSNENPPIWGRVVYGEADLLRRPDEPASDSKVFVGFDGAKAAVGAGHITQETYQKAVEVFAEGDCHAPRIAMTIQRNGKTYYRFKSAGYKAIAQRLGIVPYVECEGDKAFYLTAEEYARVFTEHKKMESQREHSWGNRHFHGGAWFPV